MVGKNTNPQHLQQHTLYLHFVDFGYDSIIRGKNDLASMFPTIADEWDYEKNYPVTPADVSFGSIKKYSWKCPQCGFSYVASINQRTNSKSGCPYCSNHKVMRGYNDFATNHPELVKEWDWEKNAIVSPYEISCNHHKKVKWICPVCKNSYEAYISNRIRGDSCPYCSGHKVLPGFNDLKTLKPELLREWDYEKNVDYNPEEFTIGSSVSVWWKCEICGHSWKSTIVRRTNGAHCPKCNHRNHTSFPEQAFFYYIKKEYSDAISSYSGLFTGAMELDIFIPSISTGIEYDGIQWHTKETESREKKKYIICKEKGIRLIRIKEDTENQENCDIAIPCNYRNREYKLLDQAINKLFQYFDITVPVIDTEKDATKINEQFLIVLREGSFGSMFPQYWDEWDKDKNGALTPYMFQPHSNEKVWWKCKKCGYSYQQRIAAKAIGRKCPNCSRNFGKKRK